MNTYASIVFLAQTTSQPVEQAQQWLEYLRGLAGQVPTRYWVVGIAVVAGWIVLRRGLSAIARLIRRRRPVNIHPSLQRYNVDRAEVQRRQRELAVSILTTSTSNRLAGFRLVRQVEAIFVEGFASPEDAMIALKATAVERGANAILNVQTQHTAAGRCTASGDAVVVAPLAPLAPPPARPGTGRPPERA